MLCDFDEVGLLRTDVEAEGPDTALVLTGELDLSSRQPFWAALSRAAGATTGRLVVDLSGVEFLDVAGLRVLEDAHRLVGDRLIIRRPSPAVQRLIELTGADQFLTVQLTPGKLSYVRGLLHAFETGGAGAVAEMVPDGVEWLPWQAEGRTLTGSRELREFWSTATSGSFRAIDLTQVGGDVVIHLSRSMPGRAPLELWSVYRFEGERLVRAVSFSDRSQALAYAA